MSIIEKVKLLFRAWKYRLDEDPDEIAYIMKGVKSGEVVFDIGAHKGGYTYWLEKAVGNSGQVYAFEPQEAGAVLLQLLFKKTNVTVTKLALSNAVGEQDFFIQPQANSVSFEASIVDKYAASQKVVVKTTTLDAYCKTHNLRPSFIKIDVEGHELEVLQGGKNLLTHTKPTLLIEIEERHIGREKMQAIFGLLSCLNYTGFFFRNGTQHSIKDFKSSIHQSMEDLEKAKKLYCNNFVFEPHI